MTPANPTEQPGNTQQMQMLQDEPERFERLQKAVAAYQAYGAEPLPQEHIDAIAEMPDETLQAVIDLHQVRLEEYKARIKRANTMLGHLHAEVERRNKAEEGAGHE